MRERLNVGKQIFAQVRHNALADALQNDRLQVGAAHREHKHPGINRDPAIQCRQRKIGGDKLLDIADDKRRDDVVRDGKQH